MCSGPHTAAHGLANHVDCEPTSRAHMRGREPTISAHEPRFMASSSQTATRTQIHSTQNRGDITVSVISHAMGVRSTRGMASSALAFKRYRKTTFPRVCDFATESILARFAMRRGEAMVWGGCVGKAGAPAGGTPNVGKFSAPAAHQ